MNGDAVRIAAQITGLLMALFLASRALRGRNMDARRTAGMAAAWIAIIVVLTFVIAHLR